MFLTASYAIVICKPACYASMHSNGSMRYVWFAVIDVYTAKLFRRSSMKKWKWKL